MCTVKAPRLRRSQKGGALSHLMSSMMSSTLRTGWPTPWSPSQVAKRTSVLGLARSKVTLIKPTVPDVLRLLCRCRSTSGDSNYKAGDASSACRYQEPACLLESARIVEPRVHSNLAEAHIGASDGSRLAAHGVALLAAPKACRCVYKCPTACSFHSVLMYVHPFQMGRQQG